MSLRFMSEKLMKTWSLCALTQVKFGVKSSQFSRHLFTELARLLHTFYPNLSRDLYKMQDGLLKKTISFVGAKICAWIVNRIFQVIFLL